MKEVPVRNGIESVLLMREFVERCTLTNCAVSSLYAIDDGYDFRISYCGTTGVRIRREGQGQG